MSASKRSAARRPGCASNRESGIGNRESGIGNWELGIGNRKSGRPSGRLFYAAARSPPSHHADLLHRFPIPDSPFPIPD
ncbi:hypothetical protein EBN15_05840 [Xanthomonas cucurbitae]|nr:hypothetical protein EBN15_05840 [Xanthomonas cucurbitae]